MKSAAAISLRAELAALADGFVELGAGACVLIMAVTIAAALVCVGMAYRSTRKLEKRLEEEEKDDERNKRTR